MSILLELAYLFFIGSTFGWVLEVLFRRFISSANPERKWINPGFCTGPYIPLYGEGLCILYLVASLEKYHIFKNAILDKLALFLLMTVLMTVIEYIAGYCSLRFSHVRLWDYSREWGNVNGIICPKFSLAWGALGAVYYFFVHPYIRASLDWLSRNLAFSFVIGMFFGVFIIDVAHSAQIVAKLKKFADENGVVVRYENIKQQIRRSHELAAEKYHFFRPFASERPLYEHLHALRDTFERIKERRKE